MISFWNYTTLNLINNRSIVQKLCVVNLEIKKMLGKKILGTKKVSVQKNIWSEKFLVQNSFGSNKHFIPDKFSIEKKTSMTE